MTDTKRIFHTDAAYFRYRIPGMVVTSRGTILLYCEARTTQSDWARMDILLYRSEDGGESFDGPIVIARGTDAYRTVNNPVCIVDGDTLHFLYCRDYSIHGGDVWYRCSKDDGRTWSEPIDIMDSTMPAYHNAFALGPGHGICTADGTLLTPVWMVPKENGMPPESHSPAVVSTLFSRDHGKSWHTGEILPPTETVPDPNESMAAVLPDGRIYMNVRTTGAGFRARTWSQTGTDGWTALTLDKALPDPTCMGSVVRYCYGGIDGILAVNCASQRERANLTCRFSADGGLTWSRTCVIDPGDAGYADIAVLPDGTICVLCEKRFGEEMYLARFTINALR